MDKRRRPPPAIEDLPQLYTRLTAHLEKLEGDIKQLQAVSTTATFSRVTHRDLEPIENDIRRIKKKLGLSEK